VDEGEEERKLGPMPLLMKKGEIRLSLALTERHFWNRQN
jgi:hypothetical protein